MSYSTHFLKPSGCVAGREEGGAGLGDEGMCCIKGCFLTEPVLGYLLPLLVQGCGVLTKVSEKP